MLELLLIGAMVGIFSGLFGIGGGIILVPVLKYYYQMQLNVPINFTMPMAVASSLTIIIFTTATSSYKYIQKNQVDFLIFYNMIPVSLFGIILGTILSNHIDGKTYSKLFAILLIMVSIKLLLPKKHHPDNNASQNIKQKFNFQFYLFSLISGMLSALFGIGGGIINTPYFLYLKLNMQKAIGTNTLCCLPAAFFGASIYAFSNTSNLNLNYTTGLIHWPTVINIAFAGVFFAPIGVKVALLIKPHRLKQLFGLVLLCTSLKMFL